MEPALLLNATYEPLLVVDWKKAITLVILGKAEVLAAQDNSVRSATDEFLLPSVLRLFSRVRVPRRAVQFSRGNVYRRDGHRCQYCGVDQHETTLTFDHVLPRSRGGQTTWENIVTSCEPCNRRKGDLTPLEAEMPLLSKPKEPKWWPFSTSQWDGHHPERWKPYLWI
ncbi:HNH endonuclease [Microvenator marinus]|jgi:5-methylcytosine-specific restriction endonuclease McrA|uniref:HNH endonuclease n=1 Tax=Microvenator marinus TaxID=2600177 RepID=A0A5B8XJ22_9DELT|nr:HNH endonuclease [Microvenator marinus]QED25752.1 HNH endonuclease [Microvenator marinus]